MWFWREVWIVSPPPPSSSTFTQLRQEELLDQCHVHGRAQPTQDLLPRLRQTERGRRPLLKADLLLDCWARVHVWPKPRQII
eukprot:2848625-Pleurochrysis_carterae.AAC.1